MGRCIACWFDPCTCVKNKKKEQKTSVDNDEKFHRFDQYGSFPDPASPLRTIHEVPNFGVIDDDAYDGDYDEEC